MEEKRAALEDAAKRMTPEEYNYLMHKRDPRPEAMPQTAEQKRKEMEFVRSFEYVGGLLIELFWHLAIKPTWQ